MRQNAPEVSPIVAVALDAAAEGRVMDAVALLTSEMPLDKALATLPPAPPALGDILVCSWGYEQTNIDYYQVVALTKSSVRIRKIGKRAIGSGGTTDTVVPVPGSFAAPTTRQEPECSEKGALKRIGKSTHYRYSVRISSYSSAYPWDGTPDHETGWGYGH